MAGPAIEETSKPLEFHEMALLKIVSVATIPESESATVTESEGAAHPSLADA